MQFDPAHYSGGSDYWDRLVGHGPPTDNSHSSVGEAAKYNMQYDEHGRPFMLDATGRKSYVSPVSFGGKPPDNTSGGLLHGRWEWDPGRGDWVQHLSGGKILTYATMAALTAGGLNAAGVLGGAGGSGAAEAVNGVANAALAGSEYAAPLGAVAPVAAGAGSKLLDSLTSAKGVTSLAGLAAMLATRPGGNSGSANGLPGGAGNDQLTQLMEMASQRAQRTDPLHQAVTQLAMSRLPTNVQR